MNSHLLREINGESHMLAGNRPLNSIYARHTTVPFRRGLGDTQAGVGEYVWFSQLGFRHIEHVCDVRFYGCGRP